MTMERKRSFAPVVDEQVRVLILGSLPGALSLARNEYYANPQNRFWRLMSDVFDLELLALDYPTRLQVLLVHQIGLWDVVATARRQGSLDSRIRDRIDNDLVNLAASLPNLAAIGFNGATAARIGLKALPDHSAYEIIRLPSSSPAYTLSYREKLIAWQGLRDCMLN
jgi:hypoxanthine-DNA glycosylase